jgi:hypothetical protein
LWQPKCVLTQTRYGRVNVCATLPSKRCYSNDVMQIEYAANRCVRRPADTCTLTHKIETLGRFGLTA